MAHTMEKQFTRGNLISILATFLSAGVILVGGVTSVNRIDAKAIQNENSVARIEAEASVKYANQASQIAQMRTEITSLQVSNARTTAQYDAVSRSLDEVKSALRDLTTTLRERDAERR